MFLQSTSPRAMLPPGACVAQARRVLSHVSWHNFAPRSHRALRCCSGQKWCHNPDSLCRKSNLSASLYTPETSQYQGRLSRVSAFSMRCNQHHAMHQMYLNCFGMKIATILGGVSDDLSSSYDNEQHTEEKISCRLSQRIQQRSQPFLPNRQELLRRCMTSS